jgi:hypothetical protein
MVMARVLISDFDDFRQLHDHEISVVMNTVICIRAAMNNP